MRGDDRARVRFGRRQVPACRVPRGRLDSKANTVEAGPWVRACLSPFSLPSLCNPLSLSLSLHPIFLRPPCALGRVLSSSLARPPRFCPFPSALKRWSTGALTLLDDRPTINTPAGPYFRPRNRHFRTSLRFLSSRPTVSFPIFVDQLFAALLTSLRLGFIRVSLYIYIYLSFSCKVLSPT